MRAVVDTNVIVSSYLSPTGAPAGIRAELEQHQFELVISEELLAEYRRALAYPRVAIRHGMSEAEIAAQVEGIRRIAVLVPLGDVPNVIPEDPPDNAVIATAVAGNASYIVSGDADLHRLGEHRGIQILPPALFLALLMA
jgi:putative PIN family toxin of toxin-antitoxin system